MPPLDTGEAISAATQRNTMYKPGDVPTGMETHADFIQAWLRQRDTYMLYDIAKHNAGRVEALLVDRIVDGPAHHKGVWQMRLDWHRQQVADVLERRDTEEVLAAVTLWYDQINGLLKDSEIA